MKTIAICAGIACFATAAAAQSGPDMNFGGSISYGIVSDTSSDFEYITLDFNVQGQFAGSSGLGYFIDYAAIAPSDDLGANIDEFYYGLTYDLGPGTLQFGRPKSVISDLLDGPRFGENPDAMFFFGQFAGSILPLILVSDDEVYGLRYDGNAGQVQFGLSVHSSQNTDETLTGGVVSYDAGNFTPFAVFETLSGLGAGQEARYSLGTKYANGPFSGLISYTINPGFADDLNSIFLTGEYQVNDEFAAGLTYLHIGDGVTSQEVYGIGGQYTFDVGAFVRADITQFSGGGDPLYNFEVGYTF